MAAATLALAGCSGDGGESEQLMFTRADGSTIEFPRGASAWCGPWDEDVSTPALHVGTVARPLGEASFWFVRALPADAEPGRRLRFPLEYVWNRPRGAVIFVLDLEDPRAPKNEASTQTERSSGWVEFDAAGCRMGDEVAFTVDATVGSEFVDGEPIEVEGTLRLKVGERPPGF
jgi:hypothetical protein